jgi:transmembrane sensor
MQSSWLQHVEAGRSHVDVSWDDDHTALAAAALRERRRVRARRTRIMVVTVGICVAGLTGVLTNQLAARYFGQGGTQVVRFADGSSAQAMDAKSDLVVAAAAPNNVELELRRGAGRFRVTPDASRRFAVRAGPVLVEVRGTEFSVERLAGRTHVIVTRGRVHVTSPSETAEVGAGQERWFAEAERAAPPVVAPDVDEPVDVPVTPKAQRRVDSKRERRWRMLASQGQFDEAYGWMRQSADVRDEAEELLLAADVARLAGHPNEALPYLEQVFAHHPGDPRVVLARFTLGRILMDDLGRPAEAAEAFAAARRKNPDGPLAEDALAREVQALFKAGNTELVRTRAQEFMRRYPTSKRVELVRRYGGL